MLRRPAIAFYLGIPLITIPFFSIVFLWKGPDLSVEQVLQHKIAELQERLRHAEMMNQERSRDVLFLRQNFGLVLQATNLSGFDNSSELGEAGSLVPNANGRRLIGGTRSLDLQLPSIHHYLGYLPTDVEDFQPAFKLSKGRNRVSMVLGIPTVRRQIQSYLLSTLQNLIESMSPEERLDVVIIVFIAETDINYVAKETTEIQNAFQEHIKSGLLEVIAPPAAYYPEFDKLAPTLGDPLDRVKWRTKQNLDFAYLMMYAQSKGTFYVQLEDDILSKPGYIGMMKNFAYKQVSTKKDWLILDFCQLGFIGKLFKCVDLSKLVTFFLLFYQDKPVDWLLDHFIQTKVCRFDKDAKECKKQKDMLWLHFKPSLFQHVGTHSSLKGKVQKLKDKQFGKLQLFQPHKNPPAEVTTNMKAYRLYTLQRAYRGDVFFWSLLPQKGDTIIFKFTPPIVIEKFRFRSGNAEHPDDRFVDTTVELLPEKVPDQSDLQESSDGFYQVGEFKEPSGLAEGEVPTNLGPIKTLRMTVHSNSDHWAILSEILVQPAVLKNGSANS